MGDDDSEWRTTRERITYDEGRRVLEAQKSDIDDMDDKALRTVRITALLLGVGATGVRVIGLSSINRAAGLVSVFWFLLSLVFGVLVYNESDEVIGPSGEYLGTLRRNETARAWDEDLLFQLERIEDNQRTVEFNGLLLFFCQSFFILGIATGTVSLLSLGGFGSVRFGLVLLLAVGVLVGAARLKTGEHSQ